MFCSKCGQQNPDNGSFCRDCGTSLSTGSTGPVALTNKRGKTVTWESSMIKLAMGVAFLAVSVILGVTGMAGGRNWWFWMLIPAFIMMASGIAQVIQIRKVEKGLPVYRPDDASQLGAAQAAQLPSAMPHVTMPESRYKTGDLVPPSVTDGTTRLLDPEAEGKTMPLPQK